jgi:hypothetical protein
LDDAQLVELTNVIAMENLRGRFNLALGIGAAGFSEGLTCIVPETTAHGAAGTATAPAASASPAATSDTVAA